MAEVIEVEDDSDSRLDAFLRLRDVSLRQRWETENGIYLAEGEKVIRRALGAGHEFASFLLAPRWLDALGPVVEATTAPCFVLTEAQIEQLTGFHVHRGALAAVHRPAALSVEEVLSTAQRVIVLEDLADHANVGAIFRSAAAFGFDGVLLSPRCADPWYRRAIKTSMGAVFTTPFARIDDWFHAADTLREHGFASLAMTLDDDSENLDELPVDLERIAVMIGAEGHGLSTRWQHSADMLVKIPITDRVDSLNAAAATAVACWQLRPRS